MSLVGFDVGGVDGRYGPKSESAVKDLQQRFKITVDGVVGPDTWAVIDALEDEGPAS
jgi:peptidoglycan hydrolase-like protein with peptidoglycan-binding domain